MAEFYVSGGLKPQQVASYLKRHIRIFKQWLNCIEVAQTKVIENIPALVPSEINGRQNSPLKYLKTNAIDF